MDHEQRQLLTVRAWYLVFQAVRLVAIAAPLSEIRVKLFEAIEAIDELLK